MVEIKKEKQIYHCLNTVYKNHLSTHCTFIYLPLKILKLLHWEQTTNRASRNIKNTQPSESELGVNFPFFFLQLFRGFDYWPLNGGWLLNRWPLNGGSTVYRVGKRAERKSYMMASQYYRWKSPLRSGRSYLDNTALLNRDIPYNYENTPLHLLAITPNISPAKS